MTVDIQAEVEHAAQYWASQQERSSSDVPLSLLVITESGERVVMGFADGMSDELRPQFGRVVREAVGQSVNVKRKATHRDGQKCTRLSDRAQGARRRVEGSQ